LIRGGNSMLWLEKKKNILGCETTSTGNLPAPIKVGFHCLKEELAGREKEPLERRGGKRISWKGRFVWSEFRSGTPADTSLKGLIPAVQSEGLRTEKLGLATLTVKMNNGTMIKTETGLGRLKECLTLVDRRLKT